jgi:alkanesulfonate monooxygenase SsuD/methylene tetrahydromethanopterin reductase-like flavin-dependent oxidoreductase (luciferase family)
MRFQLLDILPNIQNPVTGRLVSTADRLEQALTSARQAEKLGFDAVAVGERHAGPFLSAGVTVILGAIAAASSRVRIQTGVSVLSVLDPLRVAEDYATIDQLSRGRVELVIGKGNELRQLPMFGVASGEQWDQLAEKYELLRRLWREENVSWEGKFRGPLDSVTSLPRPYAGAPRVWHGSATTLVSAALAARWGDPLFSANAIQPRANYQVLIDHYRAEYARHGHDPRYAYVGAGSGFLFLADTTQEARERYGPIYEQMIAFFNRPGNHTPGNEMTHVLPRGVRTRPAVVQPADHDPARAADGHARAARGRGHAGRPQAGPDHAVDRPGSLRRPPRVRRPHGPRRRRRHRTGHGRWRGRGQRRRRPGRLRRVAAAGGARG